MYHYLVHPEDLYFSLLMYFYAFLNAFLILLSIKYLSLILYFFFDLLNLMILGNFFLVTNRQIFHQEGQEWKFINSFLILRWKFINHFGYFFQGGWQYIPQLLFDVNYSNCKNTHFRIFFHQRFPVMIKRIFMFTITPTR